MFRSAGIRDDERRLAEDVVAFLAPDESPFLAQLMTRPPLSERFSGHSLGYGAGATLAAIAPYVLIAAVWVKTIILDEAKSTAEKRLRKLVRRVLGVHEQPELPKRPTEHSPEEFRAAIVELLTSLDAKPADAALVADAIVGRVLLGDPK